MEVKARRRLVLTFAFLLIFINLSGPVLTFASSPDGAAFKNFLEGYYYTDTEKAYTCVGNDLNKIKEEHPGKTVFRCTQGDTGGKKAQFEKGQKIPESGEASKTKEGKIRGTSFGEGDQLTQIFNTAGFQGSAAALSKASFVGKIMGIFISYACLCVLCTVVIQVMFTMIYVSSPVLWNKVDALNKDIMGDNPFALSGLAKGKASAMGKPLGAFDKVVNFVFTNLLNIKELSDYSDDGINMYGLDASKPTMLQYFSKRSLQIILILFFASIGYNGALLRAYATVVEGMGQALERVIDADLAATVDKFFDSGNDYRFSYDADKTPSGELTQAAVRQIYSNANTLLDSADRSKDFKQALGYNIDRLYGNKIASKINEFEDPKNWNVSVNKRASDNLYGCTGDDWVSVNDYAVAFRIDATQLVKDSIEGGQAIDTSNMGTQYIYVYLYRARDDSDGKYLQITSKNSWTSIKGDGNK